MMSNDAIYWQCRSSIERAGRAYAYLMDQMGEDDATRMIVDCQPAAGWFALETLAVESVYDDAVDRWREHPGLLALCREAAQRVGEKWSSSGDVAAAACDWALDLVSEYASADGIELVEIQAAEEP